MNIEQINKLKVGDTFQYQGKPAQVISRRKVYPSDFVQEKDDKGKTVTVERPDRSLGLGFVCDGVVTHLESHLDDKMIREEKFVALDLSDYQ